MKEQDYTDAMSDIWYRKPAPFNPEYRDYAAQMLFNICDEFEWMGYYEIYSREELRQMIKEEYAKRMTEKERK